MFDPRKVKSRSKSIPVHEDKSPLLQVIKPQSQGKSAYQLHIASSSQSLRHATSKSSHNTLSLSSDDVHQKKSQAVLSKRKLFYRKAWNALEWLATSALIFTVLFFIINYPAYSTLLISKLDRLRGNFHSSPFIQSILQSQSTIQTQQPLPMSATASQSKKQIPYLALEIAPIDDRIIIPRINRNVPILRAKSDNLIKRNWDGLEKDIQEALRDGVVHYPGTAIPGEKGNIAITGHSSYFSWDPGRFKDVFALLHELKDGDKIIIFYQQKKYFYEVYDIQIVMPEQVDILTQKGENRLTLITCTPIGTNLKRLIVLAKPI